MREIDKNLNNLNLKGIQLHQSTGVQKDEEQPTVPEHEFKEVKDLAGMPAFLGKSQISSDSVESDMRYMMKNPAQVEQLNAIFDEFAKNNSYEEATRLIDGYKNEFVK